MTSMTQKLANTLKTLFDDYKEFTSSGDAGNWRVEDSELGKMVIEVIDEYEKSCLTETNLVDEVKNLALLAEASIEAIQYAIDLALLDSDDSMSFLQAWNEGDWTYIVDMFPNFNINSEAQQTLIKESGGMST